jgi:hypothetical protein
VWEVPRTRNLANVFVFPVNLPLRSTVKHIPTLKNCLEHLIRKVDDLAHACVCIRVV